MDSYSQPKPGILIGEKFPNIPYYLLLYAAFFTVFYLMNPGSPLWLILIGSVAATVFLSMLESWALRFRLKLTEKRLLKKDISGDAAAQYLTIRRRNIIITSYRRVCTVFLLGLIVYFFHLGPYNELPFWKSMLVIITAFSIPDLIFDIAFKKAGTPKTI
jgi:hypothetical protein